MKHIYVKDLDIAFNYILDPEHLSKVSSESLDVFHGFMKSIIDDEGNRINHPIVKISYLGNKYIHIYIRNIKNKETLFMDYSNVLSARDIGKIKSENNRWSADRRFWMPILYSMVALEQIDSYMDEIIGSKIEIGK